MLSIVCEQFLPNPLKTKGRKFIFFGLVARISRGPYLPSFGKWGFCHRAFIWPGGAFRRGHEAASPMEFSSDVTTRR